MLVMVAVVGEGGCRWLLLLLVLLLLIPCAHTTSFTIFALVLLLASTEEAALPNRSAANCVLQADASAEFKFEKLNSNSKQMVHPPPHTQPIAVLFDVFITKH